MEYISFQKGATFSPCQNYRYRLWRIWDEQLPEVLFIMHNPSTADHRNDDPTLRRCLNYAIKWGFGQLTICNVYAYRSTDPKMLSRISDPIGPNNDVYIKRHSAKAKISICAWGNGLGLPKELFSIISNPHFLECAKYGTPKHPLYLQRDIFPKPLVLK